ncbi:putative transporter [Colletotrichum spaethianum]|uniref:Transporter n=1 Tax=Colletotrichum spaethianum TaxID=700344 RepID=A0AA37PF33_9PEZI|nr:putative transporter [Colletotrichum spaethianum]GKT51128.1 putative transporter [Colletotrichum spaethianum]
MDAAKDNKISPTSQPAGSVRDGSVDGDNGKSREYDDDVVRVIDKAAERRLCRKLDFHVLPVLAIMYLFNALDKGNLGNAETDGLSTDLNFKDGQYNLIVSIFFVPYVAAAPFANAFSGLLAFGVFHITNTKLYPWRWLFIIEATATILFAAFAFWYLPRSAAEAKFLTAEEKELALHRVRVDSSSIVGEKMKIREAAKVFKHPTTYGFLAIEICLGVPLQSVSLFMPQIVQRLGYSTIKTNLYTVAPNVSGAAMLLILAFLSDWRKLRFPFIAIGFLLTFIGFIIYAAIDDVEREIKLAYYACFMMTWGTSAPSVLLSTWYNNNVVNENQRVLLTSIGVPLANLMGLVSSNIFRKPDAPKYAPALITTACFGGVGALCALALGFFMVWDNKRRNREQGVNLTASDVSTSKLGDGPKSPNFRWFL